MARSLISVNEHISEYCVSPFGSSIFCEFPMVISYVSIDAYTRSLEEIYTKQVSQLVTRVAEQIDTRSRDLIKELTRLGSQPFIQLSFQQFPQQQRLLLIKERMELFRKDLYYRLMVVPLTVPPLRRRGKDVYLLLSHYCRVFNRKFNKPWLKLSREVGDALAAYDWPGNVRELKNLLEQLVILSEEGRNRCPHVCPRHLRP